MKIGVLFGTRPEVIKCIPVVLEAKRRGHKVVTIFTGQHKEMALPLLSFFDILVDISLNVMKENQTLSGLSQRVLEGLDEYKTVLQELDVLLVQGDTTSAFTGAYWGFVNQIKIGHIEAGLRTYNLAGPFPEEGNRQLISKISSFHFAPTELAKDCLYNEGVRNGVRIVGNTSIDMVKNVSEKISLASSDEKRILVTAHRRENFDGGIDRVCDAIMALAKDYPDYQITFPVHKNPNVRTIVNNKLEGFSNIKLTEPMDYLEFVTEMTRSSFIISDSGGVQEEAPSIGKKVIVLRDETERMEAVEAGFCFLVGTNVEKILLKSQELMRNSNEDKNSNVCTVYGDGKAASKIIDELELSKKEISL